MFIDRSVGPKLAQFRHAQVSFFSEGVAFNTSLHANKPYPDSPPISKTTVLCEGIDWQVSHMAQVLSHFSATLSNVVHLKLEVKPEDGRQLEGTDDVEWLHLLHQFSTVQTLHVSHELAGHVTLALENISQETVTETPPSLDLIFLAGQPASSIENFVAARQLSGRAVKGEFDKRVESYVNE